MDRVMMREYVSLRKWTLFSVCVYQGLALVTLILCDDLLDDLVNPVVMRILWATVLISWPVLTITSIVYLCFKLKSLRWLCVLPLAANAVTFAMSSSLANYSMSSLLEFSVKKRGFEHIVSQLDQGPMVVMQEQSLPADYQYLTRYSNRPYKIIVTRRNGIIQIYFPLQPGWIAGIEGVVYSSTGQPPTKVESPYHETESEHSPIVWPVRGNWFYYSYGNWFL